MSDFKYDVYRYYENYRETFKQKITRPDGLRYLKVFRKCSCCHNDVLKLYYRKKLRSISRKTFIQIPHDTRIGKGFYIGHNGRIIINEDSIIGDNCNIATGVIIGQENRGKRKGCPRIKNKVWIGANSVIVGKVVIGSDVLIAPLTYINFDVPDHSIVIGNPGKIIPKDNATKNYINKIA